MMGVFHTTAVISQTKLCGADPTNFKAGKVGISFSRIRHEHWSGNRVFELQLNYTPDIVYYHLFAGYSSVSLATVEMETATEMASHSSNFVGLNSLF